MCRALSQYRNSYCVGQCGEFEWLPKCRIKLHNRYRTKSCNDKLRSFHINTCSHDVRKARNFTTNGKSTDMSKERQTNNDKHMEDNSDLEKLDGLWQGFQDNSMLNDLDINRTDHSVVQTRNKNMKEVSEVKPENKLDAQKPLPYDYNVNPKRLGEKTAVENSNFLNAPSPVENPTEYGEWHNFRELPASNKLSKNNTTNDNTTSLSSLDRQYNHEKETEIPTSKKTEDQLDVIKMSDSEEDVAYYHNSILNGTIFSESRSTHDIPIQPHERNSQEISSHLSRDTPSLLQPSRKSEYGRIHIMGMGPTGQYIAHHISQLYHSPPLILLMHDPLLMQKWDDEGAAIRVIRNDKIITQTNFHVESSSSFRVSSPGQRYLGFGENLQYTTEPPDYAIDNLIVATKSFVTIAALQSIKHRIKSTTTVCIIEKGMGIVQKLNKLFFTDSNSRPTYVLGHLSHNLAPTENHFTHIEKGPTEFYCSKLPRLHKSKLEPSASVERVDFSWSPGAMHLVGTLLRVPELNTITLGHKDFHVKQLFDLVTCAVIEPLSVAFDCTNGQLLYNYGVTYFMRKLLQEISLIITSLPELRNIQNVNNVFSPERLERKIIGHLQRSEVTVSPMLVDLRAGQRTSIDFYTGYLIDRATELDIPCTLNQMIYNLVRGKQTIKRRKDNNYIPFR